MSYLESILKPTGKLKETIDELGKGDAAISVFGADFSARVITASLADSFIYVCADFVTALKAYEILSSVRSDCVYLPAKDDVLTFIKGSGGNINKRLGARGEIARGKAKVIVTTVAAMLQLYPIREDYLKGIIHLKKDEEYDLYDVVEGLARYGYRRVTRPEAEGEFAVRGSILDVFSPGEDNALRIEFFGDTVDSIAVIDVETQSSLERLSEATLIPCTEVYYSNGEEIAKSLDKYLPGLTADAESRIHTILSEVRSLLLCNSLDNSLSYIMPLLPHGGLSEFSGIDTVIYDESKRVYEMREIHIKENASRTANLLEKGEVLKFASDQLNGEHLTAANRRLAFHKLTSQNRLFNPTAVFELNQQEAPSYNRRYEQLIDDCRIWRGNGYSVHILAGEGRLKDSVKELFEGAGVGGVSVTADGLYKGAVFHEQKTVLIGRGDLVVKQGKKTVKRSKKDVFTLPEVGEYVVHDKHGIGMCEAIKSLDMGGSVRDYLVINYRDGDKLYVPVENMDSLSKYVAGEAPRLSKIGGADFTKVKLKVKAGLKQMAFDLLTLYSERSRQEGYKYLEHTEEMREFYSAFPYVETEDQLSATEEGLKDLANGRIMDRLLCGDVGYGKTEVAMRIAYNVVLNGKQVAFLSPTTILAKQHYHTLTKRMGSFGVNVVPLTRFESAAAQSQNIHLLKEGRADVVCGTHRILSKDVEFRDLGLLILDEEQRFGVEDKERIKLLKKNVNVLTLSATPIPRTLHMSMTGIRDMSVLDTPPMERIPVQTYVTEFTEGLLVDAVEREVNRGGQVFIVYNRVADIDRFAARVSLLLPRLKISVAHGQMPENRLEEVIDGFVEGNSDILIASTIIENGIDMPRANTMIVMDSDRLGLSQLYQLRGRIGRSNRLGYVFFTYDGNKLLSDTAYKRLDAITQFTSFGSGFKIAMRDLEIRGAGDVLGKQQHGHMEKVGYDMYCKLLKETVEELRENRTTSEKREVKVYTDMDAYVPDGFVPDNRSRLELYSRISRLSSVLETDALIKDVRDIYGSVPSALKNLMYLALIKNLASGIGASSVTFKRLEGIISFDTVKEITEKVVKNVSQSGFAFIKMSSKPQIVMNNGLNARRDLINFLVNCNK